MRLLRQLPLALVPCIALAAEEAAYVEESPLPQGWPQPGPYNHVVEKRYPAYRAAFTSRSGETSGFWTLFRHISKRDIPMTSPVEMPMEDPRDPLETSGMGFLYRDVGTGEVGAAERTVEVVDVPAAIALSYAWQGVDSAKNRKIAREALDAASGKRRLGVIGYRLLGYNGPKTPEGKRTWELQALLK